MPNILDVLVFLKVLEIDRGGDDHLPDFRLPPWRAKMKFMNISVHIVIGLNNFLCFKAFQTIFGGG